MPYNLLQLLLLCLLLVPVPARGQAVDVAPRNTEREIIERLTTVEEAIKRAGQRIDGTNQRRDDTNQGISDLQDAVDRRPEAECLQDA